MQNNPDIQKSLAVMANALDSSQREFGLISNPARIPTNLEKIAKSLERIAISLEKIEKKLK
jgi:hypothetical protein